MNSGRVLLVEDETALLRLMEKYLGRLGYTVNGYRTGQEALHAFEAEPHEYALAIADLTLPDMSGEDLLLRLLALQSDLRVLLCSGYPYDGRKLDYLKGRQYRFLQKPFLPKMLADTITQMLGQAMGA